jgi:hypothetical protein
MSVCQTPPGPLASVRLAKDAANGGPRYLPRYLVPSLNGRISTNASLIIITNEKVLVLQEFSDRWFIIINNSGAKRDSVQCMSFRHCLAAVSEVLLSYSM